MRVSVNLIERLRRARCFALFEGFHPSAARANSLRIFMNMERGFHFCVGLYDRSHVDG